MLHPDYYWRTLDYDVAVIKTSTQFSGPNIRPTLIANEVCYTPSNTPLRLAGWGLNDNLDIPDNLLQTCLYTISTEECQRYWRSEITDR